MSSIGSSTGIGLEVAKHFARQDVDLVVTSHLDDVFDAEEEIERDTGRMCTDLQLRTLSEEQIDFVSRQMVIRPGLIRPENLAGAFMFLSSDAASEITGQEISVDRGQTIGGNQG